MPTTPQQILEQANAAISRGDVDGFLRFCTDDTTWTFLGDRTLSGKQAVREWMRATYHEPPRVEVHRMISQGDHLVAIGEIRVTDDKGSTTHHAYCDVWRIQDGRLAELEAYVVPI